MIPPRRFECGEPGRRSAHAVGLIPFDDVPVGVLKRGEYRLGEQRAERHARAHLLDRDPARQVARAVPAHPVGDHEERRNREVAVLIHVAHAAHGRGCAMAKADHVTCRGSASASGSGIATPRPPIVAGTRCSMPEDFRIWGVMLCCSRALGCRWGGGGRGGGGGAGVVCGGRGRGWLGAGATRSAESSGISLLPADLAGGERMPQPGVALEKLGFLTIGLFDGQDPGPGHQVTLEMIELAERLGFDSAWLRCRHLQYGISSPVAVLAAASQRTARIELGTAVIPLGWENPLRLAEDLATVDVLSGGRINPGFSVGQPMHWADVREGLYPDTAAREDFLYERVPRLLRFVAGEPAAAFAGTEGFEQFSSRVEPHSPGLRARMGYGGAPLASAPWGGPNAANF